MTNRVQTLRSSVAGNVPTAGSRQPGELWLNFADNQIGYIDASKTAQKLQAVRFFSTLASYAVGDCVWNAGVLYSASTAVSPGAFNPLQWTLIGGAGSGFLPLSGGTLTGPLALSSGNITVSNGNISASGSGVGNITGSGTGTFGSVSTATITATGAVATGALTTTGNLSATGTGTFGGALTSNNGGVISKGATGGFFTYDEGGSGGDTTKYFGLYRNGNLGGLTMQEAGGPVLTFTTSGLFNFTTGGTVNGSLSLRGPAGMFLAYDRGNSGGDTSKGVGLYRDANNSALWTSEAGNVLSIATTGSATFAYGLTVNGVFNAQTTSNFQATIAVNGTGANYPLVMTGPSSQHCVVSMTVNSVRNWLAGAWNNGGYYMYDASAGRVGLRVDAAGSTVCCEGTGGPHLIAGASGGWEGNSCVVVSPSSGILAGLSIYGGASSGYWAIYARTDAWTTYNMLILTGTTATGSITSNGSNAFFNTSCDARRKSNIRALTSEIDVGNIIDALKPVAFEWNPVEFETLGELAGEDVELPDGTVHKGKPAVPGKRVYFEARTDHGFIAQDLYQVLPGIVHKPEKDDLPMMADYSKIVPYLVAELQALRQRVAQLESA